MAFRRKMTKSSKIGRVKIPLIIKTMKKLNNVSERKILKYMLAHRKLVRNTIQSEVMENCYLNIFLYKNSNQVSTDT